MIHSWRTNDILGAQVWLTLRVTFQICIPEMLQNMWQKLRQFSITIKIIFHFNYRKVLTIHMHCYFKAIKYSLTCIKATVTTMIIAYKWNNVVLLFLQIPKHLFLVLHPKWVYNWTTVTMFYDLDEKETTYHCNTDSIIKLLHYNAY